MWRQITRGLRNLFQRQRADQELHDEIEGFVDHAAAEWMSRGVPAEEARRRARMEMGGSGLGVREQVRTYGWENLVWAPLTELRFAFRRLAAKPGFTAVSVMTLALGLGASTAMFSVVNGVILNPLPFPEASRVVALLQTAPGIQIDDLNLAMSLYYTYFEEKRAFSDIAMYTPDTMTVTGLAEPEEVPALVVTHRFLDVLNVQPALGRSFRQGEDDTPGVPRVALISDGYWKARFGGDPSVIGRRVLLDSSPHEIVGVLPRNFRFMDRNVSLIVPFLIRRSEVNLISFCCQGIGRMKPGVTLEQANADVDRMLALAPLKFPMNAGFQKDTYVNARISARLVPLQQRLIGNIEGTLWVLMGTVGIVLLIACANVANLLLVRAEGRRQELAVRAALGASRLRIARELMLESLLLGAAGGALGLLIAYGSIQLLRGSGFERLPRMSDISIGWEVLLFAACGSLLAGLVFGLIPVVQYVRPTLLAQVFGSRTTSQSKERRRTRDLLVVVQVTLAFTLLVGSGLMIRTYTALRDVQPGIANAESVETLRVSIPEMQVKDGNRVVQTEQEILRKFQEIAGVKAVAVINSLPIDGGSANPVYAEGVHSELTGVPPIRRFKYVSPGYIAASGAKLLAGRELTWEETYNHIPVVMVSENLARETWGGDINAAIGKRVRSTLRDDWRTVVGVVSNLHDDGVDKVAPAMVYWPLIVFAYKDGPRQLNRNVAFMVRADGRAGTRSLRTELQNAVLAVNPNLPVANVRTLDAVYRHSMARTSFTLVLSLIAGAMALFLGLVGLYGVIAYSVSQRSREIGIRLSLGAPLSGVIRMFVADGLRLSVLGAVLGLIAALVLTRLMRALLYAVSPGDPVTYIAVAFGLTLAAALASYLPARRATRINPVEALRSE